MDTKDLINTNPFTVNKNDSLNNVIKEMLKKNISHIIVKDKENILGILSEKDILSKIGVKRTWKIDISRFKISSFYNSYFDKVDISTPINDVIELMITKSYGIIPIFIEDRFAGIVTKQDLMKLALKYRDVNISEIVTYRPIIFSPDDTVLEVRDAILRENLSLVPIVFQTKVVGIVRDIDLLEYFAYIYKRFSWRNRDDKVNVSIIRDMMKRRFVTLDVHESIAQAASLFLNKSVKGVIITNEGKFIGLVTKTDILSYILYV